jgi:hypothetical protein
VGAEALYVHTTLATHNLHIYTNTPNRCKVMLRMMEREEISKGKYL